jgi:hypothetical protein
LTNAQRKISRRPLTRAENPFEKVHFDLIQLSEGYNKDCWANHFLCDATRFHILTTFAGKHEATRSVKAVLDWIKTQFDCEVKILQFDGERALGNRFKKICRKRGIQCQQTVPYTSEQNGPIERTGGGAYKKRQSFDS